IVVMVATAVWWVGTRSQRGGASGAGSSMQPLLDQFFTDADIASITQRLAARSVPYEVRAGRVFVPADRKIETLSDLYYTAVLTGGETDGGLDDVARQTSVFDPPSKTDKLFNRAREKTCERVISRFRGVRKATVVIDPTNERHISGSILPVAMADIQTQGDAANASQLSSAAVNVLTGAVAQLARDRVRVTIDGASYNYGGLGDAGSGFGGALAADELLARKQQC